MQETADQIEMLHCHTNVSLSPLPPSFLSLKIDKH